MQLKSLKIDYKVYSVLPKSFEPLLKKAYEMTQTSYSPYSHFSVGAAVLLSDGTIVGGSNQENMSYPSGLCAERVAVFSAQANFPHLSVKSIFLMAVQGGEVVDQIVSPCGACRQVLIEVEQRYGSDIEVILYSPSKTIVFSSVKDLLPFMFSF